MGVIPDASTEPVAAPGDTTPARSRSRGPALVRLGVPLVVLLVLIAAPLFVAPFTEPRPPMTTTTRARIRMVSSSPGRAP